jgi:mannose-6-phosphate isomerase-like protein (cupin superfamily)
MKIKLNDVDSKIVKENSTYTLVDNTDLKNLVVSKTILHPMQETTGHKHDGQEEVYQFVSGHGVMDVGDNRGFRVHPGDVVLIPDGAFHRVYNRSNYEQLIFVCVFDGKRYH